MKEKSIYSCVFCGKTTTNKGGNVRHEQCCLLNPNRIKPIRSPKAGRQKGCKSWNKGKTFDFLIETGKWTKEHAEMIRNKKSYSAKNSHPSGKAKTDELETLRRQKISLYAKKHFGGYRKGSGRGKKGWIRGFFCDSSYELVFVLFNTDHQIQFERCKLCFDYEFDGKKHQYHPDFIMEDGTLIELKGYHTKQVDAKLLAVNRPIRILYEKDLKIMFDWVKNHYRYDKIEDLYDKKYKGEVA